MYQMDEPPDTFSKLFWLVIALIVLLVTGYAVLAQSLPKAISEPHRAILGTAYRAITPHITFKAGILGVYIWDKAIENGLDPYELLAVVNCESGFDPYAENINKNGTKDIGIFQINDVHGISEELRKDPYWSTDWSVEKWKEDPSIWVCYTKI